MEPTKERTFAGRLNLLLLFSLTILQAEVLVSVNAQAVPESDVRAVMTALRNSNFLTAANVISYVKAYLVPKTTLLVPTDSAIFDVSLAGGVPLQTFPYLLKFHVLEGNLSLDDLKLFPVNSWIPTALQNNYLQITNSSSNSLSLNNARVIKPNICPQTGAFLACHGIDAVLKFSPFGASPLPATTPSLTPPVPASTSTSRQTPTANSSSSFTNPDVLLPRRAVAPAPSAPRSGNGGDGAPSPASGAQGMMQQTVMSVTWNVAIAVAVGLAASRALF